MSSQQELIESWKREERQPFSGWDFSYLDGRMFEEQPPWSYAARAAELMRSVRSVLDQETGGGERLLSLRPAWPARVAATEAYPPNVQLSRERLEPLGVRVVDVKSDRRTRLPFGDGEFELVLNRHGSFNNQELVRILAPGGTFLTQQVDGRSTYDLEAVFGAKPKWPDHQLANSLHWLTLAGLKIKTAQEWTGKLSFSDVGAIAYYLRAVPWLVSGFSVDSHLAGLLELQARLERGEPLSFFVAKFLIEAVR